MVCSDIKDLMKISSKNKTVIKIKIYINTNRLLEDRTKLREIEKTISTKNHTERLQWVINVQNRSLYAS